MANPGVIQTEQSALNFMSELQGQQTQAFAENQTALTALSNAWKPVLESGAVPYGYSEGLDSLLKSNIINQGATATSNAENASLLRQRQESGGAGMAPQGSQEAINALIEAKGQQSTAQNLANEKIAGYQQGETNLKDATSAELGIASGANETGLAGATTGAGDLGLRSAQEQWKENQGGNIGNILGKVGTIAGSVAGGLTGIGNVGSMFQNFAKSAPGAMPSSDYRNMPD